MSLCPETLTKIEPAQTRPVSVDDVLRHLRLEGAVEHEADLTHLLDAAIAYVEAESDLVLSVAKFRWTLDYFPCAWLGLPVRPVIDASVRYRDPAGDWQTVDPANYQLAGQANPPVLRLAPRASWPSVDLDSWGAVEITLTAGHHPPDVPVQAKQAILLLCGEWFANREASVVATVTREMRFAVTALLNQIAGQEVV